MDIAIGSAVALLLANFAVSIALLRSPLYSWRQKSAQFAIVWLIPVLGAVGIWAFLRAQYNWQRFDTRAFPEETQKGRAVEVQDAIHDAGGGGAASD